MAKVAINGLGRIGRATLKIVLDTPGLDLVAVNDLGASDDVVYLLKYDTSTDDMRRRSKQTMTAPSLLVSTG